MSPSDWGSMVPCQAGACSKRGSFLFLALATEVLSLVPISTASFSGPWGAWPCRMVQGLLTSGLISGYFLRSSKVGSHVRPSGGPNRAQDLSCFAMSLVVNLASKEW